MKNLGWQRVVFRRILYFWYLTTLSIISLFITFTYLCIDNKNKLQIHFSMRAFYFVWLKKLPQKTFNQCTIQYVYTRNKHLLYTNNWQTGKRDFKFNSIYLISYIRYTKVRNTHLKINFMVCSKIKKVFSFEIELRYT